MADNFLEVINRAGKEPVNLVAVGHPRTVLTPDGQRRMYEGEAILIDRTCPEGRIYLFDMSKPFPGYGD